VLDRILRNQACQVQESQDGARGNMSLPESKMRCEKPHPPLHGSTANSCRLNCHVSSTYRHRVRIEVGRLPGGRSGDQIRVITEKVENAIRALLDVRPWFYQD
jgi:hypothetical protein